MVISSEGLLIVYAAMAREDGDFVDVLVGSRQVGQDTYGAACEV
jgi:hypothetical protein